jgi:hypothetical protein
MDLLQANPLLHLCSLRRVFPSLTPAYMQAKAASSYTNSPSMRHQQDRGPPEEFICIVRVNGGAISRLNATTRLTSHRNKTVDRLNQRK